MLATVLIGVLALVATLVAVVGGAVVVQRRVQSAADLGALAGAVQTVLCLVVVLRLRRHAGHAGPPVPLIAPVCTSRWPP